MAELYADDEVKDKSGIYEYIFDGRQSHLNLRQFEDWQKQTMYERQKGRCPECVKEGVKRVYDLSEMHADHVKPCISAARPKSRTGGCSAPPTILPRAASGSFGTDVCAKRRPSAHMVY